MPERFPEISPPNVIISLKLVVDALGLPYRTPRERLNIHQIVHDLAAQQPAIDLGYHFWCCWEGFWFCDELKLDLEHLTVIDDFQMEFDFYREPRPWDYETLRPLVVELLKAYRVQRMPQVITEFTTVLESR